MQARNHVFSPLTIFLYIIGLLFLLNLGCWNIRDSLKKIIVALNFYQKNDSAV
jgi:hypothetical protein